MTSVAEIEGIGSTYAAALARAGIHTTDQLLKLGATSSGRMRLADETQLSDVLIKSWVHHADLIRVEGISGQYAELLCEAGVCTVPKLAYHNPDVLHDQLVAYNDEHQLVKRVPSVAVLEQLVARAKKLAKIVEH